MTPPPASTVEREYADGEKRAGKARRHVAEQLSHGIVQGRWTGSKDMVARRVGAFVAAAGKGDQQALRAAAMELAEASALLAVALDLTQTTT